MRIRQGIMAVCAVALLAGYYYLGTDYLRAWRESAAAPARIVAALQTLSRLPPPADTAARLDEARMDLAAARELLPEPVSTALIIGDILALAGANGVSAVPLTTLPRTTETIDDKEVTVLRLSVSVSGSYRDLEGFLEALASRGPEGLVIEDINVDRIRDNDGEPPSGRIFAGLQLKVYARSPGSD